MEHITGFHLDAGSLEARVPELRRSLGLSLGVGRLPPPAARELKTVGSVDRGDYIIEKLVYETLPGTLVPALVATVAAVAGNHFSICCELWPLNGIRIGRSSSPTGQRELLSSQQLPIPSAAASVAAGGGSVRRRGVCSGPAARFVSLPSAPWHLADSSLA